MVTEKIGRISILKKITRNGIRSQYILQALEFERSPVGYELCEFAIIDDGND